MWTPRNPYPFENEDTTRSPTGGLLEILKHLAMRIPPGTRHVDS